MRRNFRLGRQIEISGLFLSKRDKLVQPVVKRGFVRRIANALYRHLPNERIQLSGHGRHGRPAFRHDAVSRPNRITLCGNGPRQPFAHAALVSMLLTFDTRHQRCGGLRQPRIVQ